MHLCLCLSRDVRTHCQQNQKESATTHANGYSIIDFVLSLSLCVFALIYVMCCVFVFFFCSQFFSFVWLNAPESCTNAYDECTFFVRFLSLLLAVFDSKSNVNNHFVFLFTLAAWMLVFMRFRFRFNMFWCICCFGLSCPFADVFCCWCCMFVYFSSEFNGSLQQVIKVCLVFYSRFYVQWRWWFLLVV